MKRTLMTTALAALVASGPAFAQTQKDQSQAPNEAQGQQMHQQESAPQSSAGQASQEGSIGFVASQKENDWLASSLIGRSVQNTQGETLGDINDVVLDQNGDVVAVLIGVGGFLGLGGKDVAVQYDALEFKKREIKQPTGQDARTSLPGQANPIVEQQKQRMAEQSERKDARHSDMIIVLNASYEQLESAPAFTRLGQSKPQEQSGASPAEKQDKLKTEQQQHQQ